MISIRRWDEASVLYHILRYVFEDISTYLATYTCLIESYAFICAIIYKDLFIAMMISIIWHVQYLIHICFMHITMKSA